MKSLSLCGAIVLAIILNTSCSHKVYPSSSMPPGQAKKVTGTKSAKPYAPGQVKKRN